MNVQVCKKWMLWKYSVTAAGQMTHPRVAGIFGVSSYETLVGAVDPCGRHSSPSGNDLAGFWLCSTNLIVRCHFGF